MHGQVAGELVGAQLIGFGEDDAKGNLAFAHPVHKVIVDFLWFKAAIHEYEHTTEVFALQQVIFDHLAPARFCRLAHF